MDRGPEEVGDGMSRDDSVSLCSFASKCWHTPKKQARGYWPSHLEYAAQRPAND